MFFLLGKFYSLPGKQLPACTFLVPDKHNMKFHGSRFPSIIRSTIKIMSYYGGITGYNYCLVAQIDRLEV
jgi:hypothetical protein